MTALDLEKLEKSPPKINPKRKNMKVVNNKAMTQFGSDAFNIRLTCEKQDQAHPRLNTQKQSMLMSPAHESKEGPSPLVSEHNNTMVLTPRSKQRR